jgi:hypothetical protein
VAAAAAESWQLDTDHWLLLLALCKSCSAQHGLVLRRATCCPALCYLLQDTGQLCRTGEGAETTRLGRHYLEDCHTGEFFQLAQQPASRWWAWMR